VCTNGGAQYVVYARAAGDCPPDAVDNATATIACLVPHITVTKTVSPSGAVDQGTTLSYTITVSVPANGPALANVKVTDTMCDETNYAGNASPSPDSAPAAGSSGTIVWTLPTLAAGQSATFKFDGVVKTLASPDCQAKGRSCTNNVDVIGGCGSAQATDHASVTTPINPCPAPGLCRITGGGCLNENGDNKGHKESTFGGNASPAHDGGGPTGNEWEHVYRDGRTILFNWHSHDAHVIQCSVVEPGPCSPKAHNTRADFVGTGLYSIGAGGKDQPGNMVAYIIDHTEGACNKDVGDYYSIVVRTGLVIGQGSIVFQTQGTIDCGNLQIHETPASIFGAGVSTTGDAGAVDNSLALLNKVVPNPFSSTMSFTYEIPEGGSAVEIGVYNVAGRLVRTLASGIQGAGRSNVTWDGRDNAGVKMAQGVYFLKSVVGGKQSTFRVIYMAR